MIEALPWEQGPARLRWNDRRPWFQRSRHVSAWQGERSRAPVVRRRRLPALGSPPGEEILSQGDRWTLVLSIGHANLIHSHSTERNDNLILVRHVRFWSSTPRACLVSRRTAGGEDGLKHDANATWRESLGRPGGAARQMLLQGSMLLQLRDVRRPCAAETVVVLRMD